MESASPLISTGHLARNMLQDQVAVVTGAGSGIGYEAARALIWLGAHVIIAEIDKRTGADAAVRLNAEFGASRATFIHTDVGDDKSIQRLAQLVLRAHSRVDIVLNNAAIEPLGAVKDVPIEKWDASYRVNLRGPVLLARAFLLAMLARNCGIFVCVSSVGGPYMGPYEVLKSAQVALANTIDAELEGTGVIAFTIGPGIVKTAAADAGIKQLAPLMGKSVDEIYEMNKAHLLSVEAAGTGFAAAIALASQFGGQEINSIQALVSAGISGENGAEAGKTTALTVEEMDRALALCKQVRKTLAEQSEGWKTRSVFERGWVVRDFRKTAGAPADEWLARLEKLEAALATHDAVALGERVPLEQLAAYYRHLKKMATTIFKKTRPSCKNKQGLCRDGWRRSSS